MYTYTFFLHFFYTSNTLRTLTQLILLILQSFGSVYKCRILKNVCFCSSEYADRRNICCSEIAYIVCTCILIETIRAAAGAPKSRRR